MSPPLPWQHVDDRFCRFLAGLRPRTQEVRSAWSAAQTVVAVLRGRLAAEAGGRGGGQDDRQGGTGLIIGGYGKDTAVAGHDVVDVLFLLPDRFGAANATASPAHGSSIAVADAILAVLGARFGAVEASPSGWLTVRSIRGEAGTHTVRVLPAFEPAAGEYRVARFAARARPCAEWVIAPQAELLELNRLDATTGGKARDLVRMLKAWRRQQRFAITPFRLERLVCAFLSVWLYRRRSVLFYDWMVRDFFFWLTAQRDDIATVPGFGGRISAAEGWVAQAQHAYEAADRASRYERDNDATAALGLWREIFGFDFGVNEPLRAVRPATVPLLRNAPPLRQGGGA